jgi:hypothetical protein
MGEETNVYRVLVGKPEGKGRHLEDQGIDGRMGSKWTLGRLVGGGGIHLAQDRGHWQAVRIYDLAGYMRVIRKVSVFLFLSAEDKKIV